MPRDGEHVRQVLLGFGGNVGDVQAQFCRALAALGAAGIEPVATSCLYVSRAWVLPGDAAQPDYYNAAVLARSALRAEEIVARAHAIAQQSGPRRGHEGARWQARTLDIDTIAIEGVLLDANTCKLPHPAAFVRPFVLWPVCDVAPEMPVGPGARNARACLALLARPREGIVDVCVTWCGKVGQNKAK